MCTRRRGSRPSATATATTAAARHPARCAATATHRLHVLQRRVVVVLPQLARLVQQGLILQGQNHRLPLPQLLGAVLDAHARQRRALGAAALVLRVGARGGAAARGGGRPLRPLRLRLGPPLLGHPPALADPRHDVVHLGVRLAQGARGGQRLLLPPPLAGGLHPLRQLLGLGRLLGVRLALQLHLAGALERGGLGAERGQAQGGAQPARAGGAWTVSNGQSSL